MRQAINQGHAAYEPNTVGGGCPFQAGAASGGFVSFPERGSGEKVRGRSEKFFDHFSQATLFWNSQSDPEKDHLVLALRFELGKLETPAIRERMVGMLSHVDATLARRVADGLGMATIPKVEPPLNHSFPADADPAGYQPRKSRGRGVVERSEALSMANTVKGNIKTRKVAILAADGVDAKAVESMKAALSGAGAQGKVVAPALGELKGGNGGKVPVDFSLLTASSVVFDAVYVPGGARSTASLAAEQDAVDFVAEAYRHCKTIGATGEGVEFVRSCPGIVSTPNQGALEGLVLVEEKKDSSFAKSFIKEIGKHRHWIRQRFETGAPPAKESAKFGRRH
jgi:catalase